jgi:hypothetical protein
MSLNQIHSDRILGPEGMLVVHGAGPAHRSCGECLNLRESTSNSRPSEHARNHCRVTLFTCLLVGRTPWSTLYEACGCFAAERV